MPLGASITVYNDESEYICTSESAGFKISLQDQPEHPFPETNGFYAATGALTTAVMRKVGLCAAWHCCGHASIARSILDFQQKD